MSPHRSSAPEIAEIGRLIVRLRRNTALLSLALVSLLGGAATYTTLTQQTEIEHVHRLAQQIQQERYESCIMGNQHHANLVKVVYALLAKNNQHPTKLQNEELMDEINAIAPLHNCSAIHFTPLR